MVQIYLKWTNITQRMPNIRLVSFKRIHIEANGVSHFLLYISPEDMAVWDDTEGFVILPGKCNSSVVIGIHWNLSNLRHHMTREMCRIVQDVGIHRFYFS